MFTAGCNERENINLEKKDNQCTFTITAVLKFRQLDNTNLEQVSLKLLH